MPCSRRRTAPRGKGRPVPIIPPPWLIAALLSIASASTGQILLKIGVRSAALPPDAIRHPLVLLSAMLNPFVIVGIMAFVASMIFWLGAINGQQLSNVYPLAALGYVIVTVVSVRLFHDQVTVWKVVGIGFIVLGVILLNHGVTTVNAAPEPPAIDSSTP
jgi:multidrug transporter EmrE-like cation transporter